MSTQNTAKSGRNCFILLLFGLLEKPSVFWWPVRTIYMTSFQPITDFHKQKVIKRKHKVLFDNQMRTVFVMLIVVHCQLLSPCWLILFSISYFSSLLLFSFCCFFHIFHFKSQFVILRIQPRVFGQDVLRFEFLHLSVRQGSFLSRSPQTNRTLGCSAEWTIVWEWHQSLLCSD